MIHRKQPQEIHLSTLHDAEYWRMRAKEARAQAEQMSSAKDKRELLDIAAGFEQLAKLAAGKKILGEGARLPNLRAYQEKSRR
jgi:hypothetical protein